MLFLYLVKPCNWYQFQTPADEPEMMKGFSLIPIGGSFSAVLPNSDSTIKSNEEMWKCLMGNKWIILQRQIQCLIMWSCWFSFILHSNNDKNMRHWRRSTYPFGSEKRNKFDWLVFRIVSLPNGKLPCIPTPGTLLKDGDCVTENIA